MKTKTTFFLLFLSTFFSINAQTLQWAKQITGINSKAKDIVVDASGNVYTGGTFNGINDFDPGIGTFTMTSASSFDDVYISKLDASGNFLWAVRLGAAASDKCQSIAVDGSGNVYATGFFSGINDFDPGAGTFTLGTTGGLTAYIWKLDASGNFVMAKNIGGTGESIVLDASGNIYTTGYFSGSADFDPGVGSSSLTSAGNLDNFVSKLDASGNFVWAKSFGGTSSESSYGIAVDASGNVYTTGGFMGTADFDPGVGTFTVQSTGAGDIFVSKLNGSGNFIWAKTMGSLAQDLGQAIALDASGNVYIAGSNFGGFLAKLDPLGNTTWTAGFSTGCVPQSIAIDGSGNVITTGGLTAATDFDPGAGTYTLATSGSYDIYISKLDGSGNFIMAAKMGGTDYDLGYSVATDATGNAYLTGFFTLTADLDPGATTYTLATPTNSNPNVFVAKLNLGAVPPPSGINEGNTFINNISVYPNPFSNQITIEVKENSKEIKFVMYNSLGQEVRSEKTFDGSKIIIERGSLQNGIYFYNLISENKVISSGKMIVE